MILNEYCGKMDIVAARRRSKIVEDARSLYCSCKAKYVKGGP